MSTHSTSRVRCKHLRQTRHSEIKWVPSSRAASSIATPPRVIDNNQGKKSMYKFVKCRGAPPKARVVLLMNAECRVG